MKQGLSGWVINKALWKMLRCCRVPWGASEAWLAGYWRKLKRVEAEFPGWVLTNSPAGQWPIGWSPPWHASPAGKHGRGWAVHSSSSAAASSGRPPGRKKEKKHIMSILDSTRKQTRGDQHEELLCIKLQQSKLKVSINATEHCGIIYHVYMSLDWLYFTHIGQIKYPTLKSKGRGPVSASATCKHHMQLFAS